MEQGALIHLLQKWNAASPLNLAACWALMVELAFLGGRKPPPFAAEWAASLSLVQLRCHEKEEKRQEKSKEVSRGFLPSLENKLSCRLQGKGRTEIIYPAAARDRRAWLEGKLVVGQGSFPRDRLGASRLIDNHHHRPFYMQDWGRALLSIRYGLTGHIRSGLREKRSGFRYA